MVQVRLTLIVALLLFVSAGRVAADGPLDFSGEINRGNTLVHRFDYNGNQYEFRLIPTGGGWTIWISDPTQRDHNFVAPVTPPFRGPNHAIIEGWHFRNSDNTGPNEPGDGNLNAPQRERYFAFVLNEAGYQEARKALEILLWPNDRAQDEINGAETRLAMVPRLSGVLWIEALELGNLSRGAQAHMERMAFRVRLNLP
ncbi:MAG: hypothetical protein JSU82_04530 [Rhodospirillales bacterium]|nr:MAG: hypothetical protein JSU82_04530 [Rhodospirillales bacterium]